MSATPLPPHLPPKNESLISRAFTQRIQWFIAIIALSLVAGSVGAIITVSRIMPFGYTESGVVIRGQSSGMLRARYAEPDTTVVRRVRSASVEVFQVSGAVLSGQYYVSDAYVGTGVLLSSNGWGVVYAPELLSETTNPRISVRDHQNVWYSPTSIVVDRTLGLIYFRLSGNEFHVISFPDWRTFEPGLESWVFGRGMWKQSMLGSKVRLSENQLFDINERRLTHRFVDIADHRGIVVNQYGQILGFVDQNGFLQEAWMIEYSIPSLLETGVLPATSLRWKGYMVETFEEGKMVHGFLVDTVSVTIPAVRRGDIIRMINGSAIDEHTLHRAIREPSVTITIWRDGELFDILVENN